MLASSSHHHTYVSVELPCVELIVRRLICAECITVAVPSAVVWGMAARNDGDESARLW